MKRRYEVENREYYRMDSEWSTSQIEKFSSFSRARAYAKKLPLGGWIDTIEGTTLICTHNVSARKAKKSKKARKSKRKVA